MGSLTGKTAFITGAARGQGRAHALGLAREGADLILVDIDSKDANIPYPMPTSDDLEETASLVREIGSKAYSALADVTSLEELTQAAQDGVATLSGSIDIVCANAGITVAGDALESSEAEWVSNINVNLIGAWKTVKATVPIMVAAGNGGSVILTASTTSIKGSKNLSSYTASKHGVIGLMKCLAFELGDKMIRVNAILPGITRTPMVENEHIFRWARPDLEHPTADQALEHFEHLTLMPVPWIEAEEITAAVLWLASDASRFVTGVSLPVDAGMAIN